MLTFGFDNFKFWFFRKPKSLDHNLEGGARVVETQLGSSQLI